MDNQDLSQRIDALRQEAHEVQAHLVTLIAQIKDYEYWYEQLQRQPVIEARRDGG